jgi:cytochrome b561
LHWAVVLLVIEQYFTSAAILRVHTYRPLGRPADPFDLTSHSVHTRIGLLIFVLVALRLLLRLVWGAPDWLPRFPCDDGGFRRLSTMDFTASCSVSL